MVAYCMCEQLEIPVIVALTKIDIAPKNVAKETLQTIRQSLRRCTSLVACWCLKRLLSYTH